MNKEIALVLTGVIFGTLCAGFAAYVYACAYKANNQTTCIVEYHKYHETHVWEGRKK